MLITNPFAAPGEWYRGNLHAHTTGSDGAMTPDETVAFYRGAGYNFLSLTDHWKVTEADAGDGFLLLLGVELDGDHSEIGESYHVLGFGLERTGTAPRQPTVGEAIEWIRDHGGEAVLAHPYWSGLSVADLVKWKGHLGIEVFNTVCHHMIAKGCSAVQWDDLLSRDRLTWGFAVDDCHSARSAGFASVMVKATELSRPALMEAMRTGQFYSTTGPTIEDVIVSGGEVSVRTSPAREINFMSQSWLGRHFVAPRGETLTEATFTLRGQERYVRIECGDEQGRWAWTNPVLFRGV
jgi:hypothetical protein